MRGQPGPLPPSGPDLPDRYKATTVDRPDCLSSAARHWSLAKSRFRWKYVLDNALATGVVPYRKVRDFGVLRGNPAAGSKTNVKLVYRHRYCHFRRVVPIPSAGCHTDTFPSGAFRVDTAMRSKPVRGVHAAEFGEQVAAYGV
jgi:hypothetical protein